MVVVMPLRKVHEVIRRRMGRRVTTSTARVETDRAARYGKQLCSHLGRETEARWNEDGTGAVAFGEASVVRLQAMPDALLLTLTCPLHRRDELQGVVGRHLEKFGTRDGLTVTWSTDGAVHDGAR